MALAMLMFVNIDDEFQGLFLANSELSASRYLDRLNNAQEACSARDGEGMILT
jgi:hypothetical protein